MNIFLDDIRTPDMSHNNDKGLGIHYSSDKKWIIVRNYFDFIKFIDDNLHKVDLISFDHDIASYDGDKEFTGKDAANYLINKCIDYNVKLPNWFVHSDNTSGKANITGIMLNYLKAVEGYDISNFRYYHNGVLNGMAV